MTKNKNELSVPDRFAGGGTFEVAAAPGFVVICPVKHPLMFDSYGHVRDTGPIIGEVVDCGPTPTDRALAGATVTVHYDVPRLKLYSSHDGTVLHVVRTSDVAAIIKRKEGTTP